MNRRFWTGLLCLLLWLPSLALEAADSGWLKAPHNDHAQVRLRSLENPGKPVQLLLDIKLAPGWKTYWRSPGEGGVAPSIHWDGSVKSMQIQWPTPQRFEVAGIVTQGYHGDVSLPITLTPQDDGPLRGTLTLSTCSNVCVLTDYPFSLARHLSPGSDFAFDYSKALGAVPVEDALTSQLHATFSDGNIVISATRAQGWHQPNAYFTLPDEALPGEPEFDIKADKLTIKVPARDEWGDKSPDLTGKSLSLVLTDGGIAQQATLKITAGNSGQESATISGWRIALLALAGGFILNLMPCVLPVLGYKLGTLIQAQRRDRRSLRHSFLASSFGIVLAFALLALLMSLLRLSGQALGWGIQFQNPWFIGLLVIATLLFSASLFGLYHFRLPGNLATRMATHQSTGIWGHIVEGIFATLLATPCSAPFLGTAVAWALAAPLPALWAVFLALGIGMSLPWLLVAAWPGMARHLPKPGPWMIKLRAILGLMMLASCYWLLSLLTAFVGFGIALTLGIVMALGLLAALGRHYGTRFALKTAAIGLVAAGIVALGLSLTANLWRTSLNDDIPWQPLSEQALDKALAAHQRVFVDVTADWCVTCKANKFNVLMQPEVQQALRAKDVVALRGDWSRPNAAITAFLSRRGQVAVPFNQIYGPGLPRGQVLSPLLDTKTLLETLDKAKGTQP